MPKPQTVLCYICGREFGSYSINVHERQCAKRWESQRNKEKEAAEKREEKRKTSHVNKEKFHDPWVKRELPSTRLQRSGASKSMGDIRLSNGDSKATERDKELMHIVRPITVTLGEGDNINGDAIESNTTDNNKESPKVSRPSTAILNRYSSPLLPSKIDPTTLRKNSAPTPTCNSPDSSTSSQISSTDSQDIPITTPDVPPPRFRSTKNPNLLVCYICGNEFGSKSLKIHEPQCLKKWKLANPRYYSRKGSHGGMFKADSVNSLHGKANGFKSKSQHSREDKQVKSASCENLLDVGKTLRPTNSLQALKELSKSHGRLYTKPKMEPCYICGKEFIKHSLGVHEKQCKKKWDAIKSKNEKEEKEKREMKEKKRLSSAPKRHSLNLPVTIQVDKVDDDIQNNNVSECQSENQKEEKTVKSKSKERKPSMATCYLCGRAYGSASISIHEKQCQKKWETEKAQKEQLRSHTGTKRTKPRPRSFVL